MRDPPLCALRDLETEPAAGGYTLNQLANMHEAMDIEAEYRRRSEPEK